MVANLSPVETSQSRTDLADCDAVATRVPSGLRAALVAPSRPNTFFPVATSQTVAVFSSAVTIFAPSGLSFEKPFLNVGTGSSFPLVASHKRADEPDDVMIRVPSGLNAAETTIVFPSGPRRTTRLESLL